MRQNVRCDPHRILDELCSQNRAIKAEMAAIIAHGAVKVMLAASGTSEVTLITIVAEPLSSWLLMLGT